MYGGAKRKIRMNKIIDKAEFVVGNKQRKEKRVTPEQGFENASADTGLERRGKEKKSPYCRPGKARMSSNLLLSKKKQKTRQNCWAGEEVTG